MDGYQYGKAFDTLNQWDEAYFADITWEQVSRTYDLEQRNYYFLELPTNLDDDGVEDFIVLHENYSNESQASLKEVTMSSEMLFEKLLIESGIIQNAYSYSYTLTPDVMIVNDRNQPEKLHRIFKRLYLDIHKKDPTSNFNYQILKNQIR